MLRLEQKLLEIPKTETRQIILRNKLYREICILKKKKIDLPESYY